MKSPKAAKESGLFRQISDAQAIVRSRGVYKQVDLFQRDNKLFVELQRGAFLRLLATGGTSLPHVIWDEIIGAPAITNDALGNLMLVPFGGLKAAA